MLLDNTGSNQDISLTLTNDLYRNGYLAQFWLLATRKTQSEGFWQTYPSLEG